MDWVVGVVAVVAVVASYLTWIAGRVDRLHARAASAGRALDAQLVRRAAAAAVLSEERAGDGRTGQDLYAAARAALDVGGDDREAAENDLTRMLRKLPLDAEDPVDASLVAASRRVALARQVHNDLVRDALALRDRRLVRLLRLPRKHTRPTYFDIDDPALTAFEPGRM